MKSDLDVWAIQKYKDETLTALKGVKKKSKGNILYLNCHCKFKIGDKRIPNRNFDACFYSEDSDTVILFARGLISEEEIVRYLESEGVKYTTIRFMEPEDKGYKDDGSFPEVWFVREKYVLEDAIKDSIEKGEKECAYFPEMPASVRLNYIAEDLDKYEIEGRLCKGLLVFKEKIVLFVSQRDPRNMKEAEIRKVLKENGIKIKQKNKR